MTKTFRQALIALVTTMTSGCVNLGMPQLVLAGSETVELSQALKLLRQGQTNAAREKLTGLVDLSKGPGLTATDYLETRWQAYSCLADMSRREAQLSDAAKYYELALATQEELLGPDSSQMVPALEKLVEIYRQCGMAAKLSRAQERLILLKSASTNSCNPRLYRLEAARLKENSDNWQLLEHVIELIAAQPSYMTEVLATRQVFSVLTHPQDQTRMLRVLRSFSRSPTRVGPRTWARSVLMMVALHDGFSRLGDKQQAAIMAARLKQTLPALTVSVQQKRHALNVLTTAYNCPQSLATLVLLIDCNRKTYKEAAGGMSLADRVWNMSMLSAQIDSHNASRESTRDAVDLLQELLPENLDGEVASLLDVGTWYFRSGQGIFLAYNKAAHLDRFRRMAWRLAENKKPARLADIGPWCEFNMQCARVMNDQDLAKRLGAKVMTLVCSTKDKQALADVLDRTNFVTAYYQVAAGYLRKKDTQSGSRYLLQVYREFEREPQTALCYKTKIKLLHCLVTFAAIAEDKSTTCLGLRAASKLFAVHADARQEQPAIYRFAAIERHDERLTQIEACLSSAISKTNCLPHAVVEPSYCLAAMGLYYADAVACNKLFTQAARARKNIASKTFWPTLAMIEVPHLDAMAVTCPAAQCEQVAAELLSETNDALFPAADRRRVLPRYVRALITQGKFDQALAQAQKLVLLSEKALPVDEFHLLEAAYLEGRIYHGKKDFINAGKQYARAFMLARKFPDKSMIWFLPEVESHYKKYCQEKPQYEAGRSKQ